MTDLQVDPVYFLPLSDLTFHVLLALGSGASHGYAIGKEIEIRSGGRLSPATGSLYQALRRLHRDNLIEEAERPRTITFDDPRRQYFQLTLFGRQVFALEAERLESLLLAAREVNLVPAG